VSDQFAFLNLWWCCRLAERLLWADENGLDAFMIRRVALERHRVWPQGCATRPHRPEPGDVAGGVLNKRRPPTHRLAGAGWWTKFGDPQLQTLMRPGPGKQSRISPKAAAAGSDKGGGGGRCAGRARRVRLVPTLGSGANVNTLFGQANAFPHETRHTAAGLESS